MVWQRLWGFLCSYANLNKNSIIYSIGIGEDISFDEALYNAFNCDIFMYDPTPKSINWVKNKQLLSNYHFFPIGISNKIGKLEFLLPKNDNFISGSLLQQQNVSGEKRITVKVNTMTNFMKQNNHQSVDVLKMDIEGSEYDVIENSLESNLDIKQILIEFHSRFFPNGNTKTKNAIRSLEKHGYRLFAISDSLEEASFIKI